MSDARLEELRRSTQESITHREVAELFAEIDRLRKPRSDQEPVTGMITREEVLEAYK